MVMAKDNGNGLFAQCAVCVHLRNFVEVVRQVPSRTNPICPQLSTAPNRSQSNKKQNDSGDVASTSSGTGGKGAGDTK
jgi:hypothetical protein